MSNPENAKAPETQLPMADEENAHPHKKHEHSPSKPGVHHDHAVIRPPSTGVTHVDPGAIKF